MSATAVPARAARDATARTPARRMPLPYANPYLAGVGLGLALLTAFVLAGRGLGASGAFATAGATAMHAGAPEAVARNAYLAAHLDPRGLLHDWLVVEILGVMIGGWCSAALAGRLAVRVERGPHAGVRARLVAAVAGGVVMGAGAVLARGCTSGQALTGGALGSVGGWLFIAGAFPAAYLVALATNRSWT
jgi:uncharacterized membrane protein YedE/YeeE